MSMVDRKSIVMKYQLIYVYLVLVCFLLLIFSGDAVEVYKANAIGAYKIVPLNFTKDCPKTIDLSSDDPLYKVQVTRGCSDGRQCPITFQIPDKLQAAQLEVCGDLESIDIGNCTGDKSVSLARLYHPNARWPYAPRNSIWTKKFCNEWLWKENKCRKNYLQLQYSGLDSCDDFGEAKIFIKKLYPYIYYLDSPEDCSVTYAMEENVIAGVQSQHSLTQNTKELPEHCEITLATHELTGPLEFCLFFSVVDFGCSINLAIEDVSSGTKWLRFDCQSPPIKGRRYCRKTYSSKQSYKIILTRDRNSEETGVFFFTYSPTILPIPLTTAPVTQFPSTTSAPSSENSHGLTKTIAISISVLVAICLLIILVKCICSSNSSFCKSKEIESSPEISHLTSVTAPPVCDRPASDIIDNTGQGIPSAVPSAPPAYLDISHQNSVNVDPQSIGTSFPDNPPPKYESLFPES